MGKILDTMDPQSFYKLNRNLLKKSLVAHPLMGPNGLDFSFKKKAELLADNFEVQFTPNIGVDIQELNDSVRLIRNPHISNLDYTTPAVIQNLIKYTPLK